MCWRILYIGERNIRILSGHPRKIRFWFPYWCRTNWGPNRTGSPRWNHDQTPGAPVRGWAQPSSPRTSSSSHWQREPSSSKPHEVQQNQDWKEATVFTGSFYFSSFSGPGISENEPCDCSRKLIKLSSVDQNNSVSCCTSNRTSQSRQKMWIS